MVTIQKDEYVFEVDIEKTMDYYKTHSLCECDNCRNYYSQIRGKFPKLEEFLSQFGIDISKPDEINMSYEKDNCIHYICVDYTVSGKVLNMGQYEIDIPDNQFLSLVITDGFNSPNEQTSDYFTISIYSEFTLPWALDKPFPEPIQLKAIKKTSFLKKLFGRKKSTEKNPKECLENIKRKITEKTGISKCIDLGETSAAFSGTIDNYDLYISLDIVKKRGKNYLWAYMEGHFEWYEWEYDSQNEFENEIAEYFYEKINRTIKTITETKRHKYVRVTEYYLDKETNEWVLMSDDKVSWLIMRPFIEADDITEEIKEYQL